MDIHAVLASSITDKVALEEFVEALGDHAPNIERDIARLKASPEDREVISSLFRSIHNVKGDASLCKVELAVAIAHPIETVLARFRNDEIGFNDILAETVLLALDRLELAADCLVSGRSLEPLHLVPLVDGLDKLAAHLLDFVDQVAHYSIKPIQIASSRRPALLPHAGLSA